MQTGHETFTKTMLPPQLADDGDFAGNTYIDTAEGGVQWKNLRVKLLVGTLDAAIGSTAEGTGPFLEECDTTNGEYTAVTDGALADPIADDEDDSIFAFDYDLRKVHKRFVQVNAPHVGDGTTGANLCIIDELSRPSESPGSAAAQGLAELISA